jgi:hypothetical protein
MRELFIHLPTGWLASGIVNFFFGFLVKWIAHGAVYLTDQVIGQAITSSTQPEVGSSWYKVVVQGMLPTEELVVAPLLFAATLGAILRQDMRRLARAWGACLPLALLGGFAVTSLAKVGLGVTDELSTAIQEAVTPNLKQLYSAIVPAALPQVITSGPAVFAVSFVFLAGAMVIWIELALRSAAIELAVLFMPLGLAGLIWPATAHWAKRLLEVLAALLLAKPVIVGALCLGSHSLTVGQGPNAIFAGIAILLLAAFAPVAVLKLVPIAEASTIAHLQGLSREPFHRAERAVQMAMAKVGDWKGSAAAGTTDGEGAGGGAVERALLARVRSGAGRTYDQDHPWGPAQPAPVDAPSRPVDHG